MRTFPSRQNFATGLLTLIVAVLFACSETRCTIIYVDDDNTGGPWDGTVENPYENIQDGIDNSSPGDTVFVFAGLYYENIRVDKSICLTGQSRDSTIVDGRGIREVVMVTAGTVSISEFTIQDGASTHFGIWVRDSSSDNTISGNNIILNHGYAGIYLDGSSNNIVSGNIISRNGGYGISADRSSSNVFSLNLISINAYEGVCLIFGSSSNIISDNTFSANGGAAIASVSRCNGNQIFNNICEANATGVDVLSCTDNIVIGNTLTNNDHYGVCLDMLADNNLVSRNTITGSGIGVSVQEARYNRISDNTIINSEFEGIELIGRSNVVLRNTIINAGYGMWVERNNHVITGNRISNVGWGIYMFWNCYDDSITRNTITGCNRGIYVHLFGTHHDNTIAGNIFADNGIGISFSSGFNNVIVNNTIINNDHHGIHLLSGCYDNVFYHNDFIGNQNNAWDEGTNIWDDGYPTGGNYWDDYTGMDADGDGIGDTPYDIPGSTNQDRYPLTYVRGDVNDDCQVNAADVVFLINYVLRGGPAPVPLSAGDVNLDGLLDIEDVYYLIAYLFAGGSPPRRS